MDGGGGVMRRVVCREFGPPDGLVLEEAPDPEPGPGQVLVGACAAGVSFVDGLMVGGLYQIKPPLPFTPGLTAAGEVLGAGNGVLGLPRGSRVVGCWFGLGGYATHRVLPASAVVPLPDSVACEVAATAVESYATMLFALTRRTALRPGEWVLVLGAGGGIGLAAVDVAASLGARVIAAASSPAKRAAAVSAGAQATIDYQAEDLRARVREITGTGADLVVDPVGDRFAEPALRSLRGSGRYLVLGFAGGSIPRLPLNRVLLENRTVVGVDWGAWSRQDPAGNQALIAGLLDRAATGTLHPVAPATWPLERAAEALNALAGRQVTGKLALLPLPVQAPVDRAGLAG
jgi:NADPH:quinone reductase